MELRQLRHFVKVGEEGSISGAARALRLTQPALSRQIKALEDDLDTPLLERGAHSISLTPAGQVLLAESRKLLKFADGMAEKVRSAAVGRTIRIAYAPSLAGEFLAVAIGRFTQFHPQVRVTLSDCSSAEMRTGLATGRIDLALGVPCDDLNEPVRWETLRDYAWQVVMPPGHPLAKKQSLTPADLAGQRLLLYDREHYPEYWELVTDYFSSRNLQAKIAGEFDGVSSLLEALEGGLGIALLSESSPLERGHRQPLTARPLADEPRRVKVGAGWAADKPPGQQLQAFIEELKRAARGE